MKTFDSPDVKGPVYLVDVSFFTYMVAIATYKQMLQEGWKFIGTVESPCILLEIDVFKARFLEGFVSRLQQITQMHGTIATSPKDIVFCIDCIRKNIWRKSPKLMPDYKANRDVKPKETYSIKECFPFVADVIIPKYCDKYGSIWLKHDIAEADDCIATVIKYTRDVLNDHTTRFIIVSADRDLSQLTDEAVKPALTKSGKPSKNGVPPKNWKTVRVAQWPHDLVCLPYGQSAHDFVIDKIVMGDISDNVEGLKIKTRKGKERGIGPKTCAKLLENNKSGLKELLQEGNNESKFKLNRVIMDLDCIPKSITDTIWEDYVCKANIDVEKVVKDNNGDFELL